MPGIPVPTVLERIHDASVAVTRGSSEVSISDAGVHRLAAELAAAPERVHNATRGLMFPVKFDDLQAEITFMALYHLLDFGSGYSPLLMAKSRRDARETLQFGVIGMHLSGARLDAPWMKAFGALSVHNFFGFEATEEVPVMPGITMTRQGPLQPFSQALQLAINETGRALDTVGCRSLGQYVLAALDKCKDAGTPVTAAALIADLAATFPGFHDEVVLPTANTGIAAHLAPAAAAATALAGTGAAAQLPTADRATASSAGTGAEARAPARVPFLRKAQNLATDLQLRFAGEDSRFAFADVAQLLADTGPIVPAVLRHHGVLELSQELQRAIDAQEVIASGSSAEVALRAGAVTAAEAVCAAAGRAFSARQLSAYLTFLVEPEQELHGRLKCHLATGTVAY